MEFKKALNAKSKEERDELIESEIYNETWDNYIEDHMIYGGWPGDVIVDGVKIHDSNEKAIIVDIEITFIESVPSGCKDLNNEYDGWAKYQVIIDSDSNYHMENIDASVADDGDDSTYPGDYY